MGKGLVVEAHNGVKIRVVVFFVQLIGGEVVYTETFWEAEQDVTGVEI